MTLINDDCFEVLSTIESASIDLILTDPPYIISKKSGFSGGKLEKFTCYSTEFGEWDKADKELDWKNVFAEWKRILRPSGSIVMFYDNWKLGQIKDDALSVGLKQPRIFQWHKNNPVPVNSKLNYLTNAIEYGITFVKGSKPVFNSVYDSGIYKYPICHGKERTKHPTQKPERLMCDLLKKHSNDGDIILDPFMGSGTTGVVCKQNNRAFIGIEQDKQWFDIAQKRIESFVPLV